jgi:hypothetical protein
MAKEYDSSYEILEDIQFKLNGNVVPDYALTVDGKKVLHTAANGMYTINSNDIGQYLDEVVITVNNNKGRVPLKYIVFEITDSSDTVNLKPYSFIQYKNNGEPETPNSVSIYIKNKSGVVYTNTIEGIEDILTVYTDKPYKYGSFSIHIWFNFSKEVIEDIFRKMHTFNLYLKENGINKFWGVNDKGLMFLYSDNAINNLDLSFLLDGEIDYNLKSLIHCSLCSNLEGITFDRYYIKEELKELGILWE